MERHFDLDLEQIRQNLIRMGARVEQMIDGAVQALVERDTERAAAIIAGDREIDELEKEIDEACHTTLVRHQPAAIDLRFLVAVMKITADLERMGDSAVNIAQGVQALSGEPPLKPYIDLPRMARAALDMVRGSLDAFFRRDSRLALEVCRQDDEIDGLYKQLFRELLTYMIEDPKNVSRSLHLLLIARNLERIADHATNIAEDAIYYVEGKDIRHSAAG